MPLEWIGVFVRMIGVSHYISGLVICDLMRNTVWMLRILIGKEYSNIDLVAAQKLVKIENFGLIN